MGNCCPKSDQLQTYHGSTTTTTTNNNKTHIKAFQGEGHRLGTGTDNHHNTRTSKNNNNHDISSQPVIMIDDTLTDIDREKIRADRAAAAEARIKKQGGTIKNKSKKKSTTNHDNNNTPLRGPNSKPTMTWSVG